MSDYEPRNEPEDRVIDLSILGNCDSAATSIGQDSIIPASAERDSLVGDAPTSVIIDHTWSGGADKCADRVAK